MKYIHYNRTELLNLIDQIKVWHSIVGHCHLEEFILNPLRVDNHRGSCSLVEYNGKIVLQDWASRQYSGQDCIAAYCLLNPQFSWEQVCYNLIEISSKGNNVSPYILPGLVVKPKSKTLELIPIYRDWEKRDREFWQLRGISKSQLERPTTLVRPIEGYLQIKEDRKSEQHFAELAYCYHCNNKVKFYFPERKGFRFLGNQERNDCWLLKRDLNNLIICKSHKDMLVWENFTDYSLTHIQGEVYGHPDGHKILEYEIGFKNIFICMDNDIAGKKGAQLLYEKFIYTSPTILNISPELNCKDIDEIICKYRYNTTFEVIKNMLSKI